VELNLSNLHDLLESRQEVARTSGAQTPSARQAEAEIKRVLELLEGDLEDLDESVRAVEAVGDRWGISEVEKKGRRAFVERIKREVHVSSSTHVTRCVAVADGTSGCEEKWHSWREGQGRSLG
jgi:hypothetical protein